MFPFTEMSTSPLDPTSLEILDDANVSTMPVRPSVVVAGSSAAALGTPAHAVPSANTPAPGVPSPAPVPGAHGPAPTSLASASA
jgi:hypothetical protein